MCNRRRFAAIILLVVCYTISACAPAAPQIVTMPTLAVLPSATPHPTATPTATLTYTPRPTATRTVNLLETQLAQLNATNAAAQQTLDALLTLSEPTSTSAATLTPSLTVTNTQPPTATVPSVVPMQPQPVYVISVANLRTCASRECDRMAQLQPGDAIMATGTILGEPIDAVHGSWYRVDYQGRELYVYSQLVTIFPPAVPTSAPVIIPPVDAAPPISLPPVAGGSCPSLSATCSQLTCEQAYACLAAGNGRLDRDGDGIPCESVCLGD